MKLLNNTSVGDDDRLKRELEAFFSVCVGCKYPESKSKKKIQDFFVKLISRKKYSFFLCNQFHEKKLFFFTVQSIS